MSEQKSRMITDQEYTMAFHVAARLKGAKDINLKDDFDSIGRVVEDLTTMYAKNKERYISQTPSAPIVTKNGEKIAVNKKDAYYVRTLLNEFLSEQAISYIMDRCGVDREETIDYLDNNLENILF